MQPFQYSVISKPTTQFIEALATNEQSANYDIALPGSNPLWLVQGFTLLAVENLAFELRLYSKAANGLGVMASENLCGLWQFGAATAGPPASPGYPTNLDALYAFDIQGNNIPYRDLDAVAVAGSAHLHMRLINRSVASKTANAGGAVQITAYVSPYGVNS